MKTLVLPGFGEVVWNAINHLDERQNSGKD